jgi:hypothetical protein
MESGVITIEKAKNWKQEGVNPNNLKREFKLVAGSKFLPTTEWEYKDGRPLEMPSPYPKHFSEDLN